jgi:hypothetical protein
MQEVIQFTGHSERRRTAPTFLLGVMETKGLGIQLLSYLPPREWPKLLVLSSAYQTVINGIFADSQTPRPTERQLRCLIDRSQGIPVFRALEWRSPYRDKTELITVLTRKLTDPQHTHQSRLGWSYVFNTVSRFASKNPSVSLGELNLYEVKKTKDSRPTSATECVYEQTIKARGRLYCGYALLGLTCLLVSFLELPAAKLTTTEKIAVLAGELLYLLLGFSFAVDFGSFKTSFNQRLLAYYSNKINSTTSAARQQDGERPLSQPLLQSAENSGDTHSGGNVAISIRLT